MVIGQISLSKSRSVWHWLASAVLLVVVLSTFLSSEAVSDDEVELEKVRLQLRWHHHFQFAGYYAALEQGFYREAGLDVELVEGGHGINFADEVTSGRANFGIELPGLLIERERGRPVVILASIFQHSPLILVTKADSGLTTPQDLTGHTIASLKDSDAELLAMLVNEGVSLDEVTISELSWEIDDLISGKVDALPAYSTNEPHTLTKQNVGFTVIRPLTYGIDFYGDTLFTSQEEIDNHPRRVKAFREASLRGWAWALEHPRKTIDLIIRDYHPQYSREDLTYEAGVIQELIRPELIKIGHVNPGRWKHIADTFVSLEMLDPGYSLDGFIYDPNPAYDNTLARRTLIVLAAVVALIGAATLALIIFNRRLKVAVAARTEELSAVNVAMRTEISMRREIETALRRSEVRQLAITNALPDSIYLVDEDGVYREILRPPGEPMRRSPIARIGKTLHEVHTEELADTFADGLKRTLQTGESQIIEYTLPSPNGALRFEGRSSLIETPGDEKNLVVFAARDITERQRSELQLRAAKEEAEIASRAKSEFLASMSHELRTPLNAILGFAQIMQLDKKDSLSAAHLAHVEYILDGGNLLLDLINQVLDLARVEADQVEFDFQSVDLNEVLEECVAMTAPLCEADSIQIVNKIPQDEEINLRVDELRLKQSLINLLSNAIKYNNEGGTVTLEGRVTPEGFYHMSVKDTGVGIAMVDQDNVFKMFHRFTSAKQARREGSGIGLSVTRLLIEKMGGEIGFETEVDVGSTFWLELPLASLDETMLDTRAGT